VHRVKPAVEVDAAERAQFIRLLVLTFPPAFFLLTGGEGLAYAKGWIGGWTLVLLLLLNIPAVYGLSLLVFRMLSGSARGFSNLVLAAGNLPPDPAHSPYEALTARGFYAEAAAAYRQHLVEQPQDHLARVKLADLYRNHLADPDAAERLYLEIRRGRPSPSEDRLASNLLIELYRKSGRKDRLMVELARFADHYKGTRAGEDAARTLREMKEEMRG
jgi:hypothetical protein